MPPARVPTMVLLQSLELDEENRASTCGLEFKA